MILLPHDLPAERAFLGAMILTRSRRRMVAMVSAIKPAGRGVFFDAWHASVYDAIAACWKTHRRCDAILLRNQMDVAVTWGNAEHLDGPLAALAGILNSIPAIANGPYYGAVLLHLWTCREICSRAVELGKLAANKAPLDKLEAAFGEIEKVIGA